MKKRHERLKVKHCRQNWKRNENEIEVKENIRKKSKRKGHNRKNLKTWKKQKQFRWKRGNYFISKQIEKKK